MAKLRFLHPFPAVVELRPAGTTIGSAEGVDVLVSDAGLAPCHAAFRNPGRGWILQDLSGGGGCLVDGIRVVGEAPIRHGQALRFGPVEATLDLGWIGTVGVWWTRLAEGVTEKGFLPSLILHLAIVVVLSQLVLVAVQEKTTDFESDGGGFVVEKGDKGRPAGGEAAAGPPTPNMQVPQPASMSTEVTRLLTAVNPASSTFSVSVSPGLPQGAQLPSSAMGSLQGGGGGRSYVSAGLGKGSGLGKGIGDWVGGGSGGIGISGRGKSLRTLNEFSAYFVIHSGDWFAALDWREAPRNRQQELSPPGLPDEAHIDWYKTTPVPNTGPFISWAWGVLDTNGTPQDHRNGLVEFTPGAIGNLLRFVRQASNDNIKGAPKPKAVVLDKSLIPYTFHAASGTLEWNAAGREALREVLRKGLPSSNRFGLHGYIWNPQPGVREHPDFTVEYLLDVKPMPPFIYFTGNDDFVLSDTEVETLYQYVLRGGAIWGDCGFAGSESKFDVAFRREMKRVIPDVDKNFRPLRLSNDLFLAGMDAYFDLNQLPHGMQFYQSPIEVIELMPGLVSVVLTKNAYGNFLRFEMAMVNNKFQIGGEVGRGMWVNRMWSFREEFFRGLDEDAIYKSYQLGANILVYMLGRWPAILNRPENKDLFR